MVLYLSSEFLSRLRLIWKTNLKAFLIGDRNLYFFTPDNLAETNVVNAGEIDVFLAQRMKGQPWELLGFLAPAEQEPLAGYVQVCTKNHPDPAQWEAKLYLQEETGPAPRSVQIQIAKS
jgi:hypothetical protein